MSRTQIETMLWHIKREIMMRHGCDAADRYMDPLNWYINTGRASLDFLRALLSARPVLVARDLAKEGSYNEAINRVCKRIKYNREGI
jgi:hypothetical protein